MRHLTPDDFKIALIDVLPADHYLLKEVNPIHVYEDGKRTDKVEGYRYTLADLNTVEIFDVKVKEKAPVVSQETLAHSDRLWVSLEGAVIKPYKIEYGKVSISITADKITLVKE